MSSRNGGRILPGTVCIREVLLCGKGVEPPRGRGRLSGVRETQRFLCSNQSNRVDYADLIILQYVDISCNGAKMYLFFFFKQKTAYEIGVRLVGSEMCIRDRHVIYQALN